MLTKTIEFKDYNGNVRKEDHFFNLSKAELLDMEMSTPGGLRGSLQAALDSPNQSDLWNWFKNIVFKSYGKKDPEGRKFVKSQEILDDFIQTEAYTELLMELTQNTQAAIDFVNGIIPADMEEEVKKAQQAQISVLPPTTPATN